ncbi:MAG: cell division protease FtsH [Parcubacteria group bacterium Greene1014_47]|nr:MAG: cell division protease FtsH [Parcubacteria group bacterium Greene1014_47]
MDGFERDDQRIVMGASVTGDTPVLIRENGEDKLLPIDQVIDPYYQEGEEGVEKPSQRLEVLGFEKKIGKGFSAQKKTYLQNSAFKKVRSVFRHKVQEIYEVEYMGGTIRTTGNHSVFIRTNAQGLVPKPVCEIKPGDILVDLPYKVNRTNKNRREIRGHKFSQKLELQLQLWEPLFMPFQSVEYAYQFARTHEGETSQTELGNMLGFSQRTIGKWQQGICVPRALSRNYYQYKDQLPETVEVSPELMRLFGYYTAEGYARKELDFCFNEKEKEYIEDVRYLMKTIFHLEPDRERHITKNAINIVYHCKPVASFLAFHCGKGAKNKQVPQFLFEAPKEYYTEFLKGYAAGDGYTDTRGRLELTSVSKRLILGLNWLSRMHGFKSYIREFTVKAGRKIRDGKPLQETKAYRLGFGKTQNPLDPKIGKASTKRAIVKSIRKLPYDGYVYDFCGCENEAFFGGESPILLHNTNRPDVLDSALLRPGRFDRRIVLDLPDVNDREEILKIHSLGKPLAPKTSLREIAERTPGFSGADLANLMNESAILTARRNKTIVSQEELLESIDKVLLGPERKSHILSKKEKEITAYHEAGHALVASSLPHADPVRKVSIISRGRAGGYTLKLPSEEKHLKSRAEFLDELATFLGGYCAEKLVFKDVTTGASNDLQQASDLARRLVKEYGMSESLGPVTFGEREEHPFAHIGEYVNYSQKLAEEIDKEVSGLVEVARKKAENVLKQKRPTLVKIAKALIEKETLEREEFERLIGKKSIMGACSSVVRARSL